MIVDRKTEQCWSWTVSVIDTRVMCETDKIIEISSLRVLPFTRSGSLKLLFKVAITGEMLS